MSETVQEMGEQAADAFMDWLAFKGIAKDGFLPGVTAERAREMAECFIAGYLYGRESRDHD